MKSHIDTYNKLKSVNMIYDEFEKDDFDWLYIGDTKISINSRWRYWIQSDFKYNGEFAKESDISRIRKNKFIQDWKRWFSGFVIKEVDSKKMRNENRVNTYRNPIDIAKKWIRYCLGEKIADFLWIRKK